MGFKKKSLNKIVSHLEIKNDFSEAALNKADTAVLYKQIYDREIFIVPGFTSSAIQKTVYEAANVSGIVFFPPGTYWVDSVVFVPSNIYLFNWFWRKKFNNPRSVGIDYIQR